MLPGGQPHITKDIRPNYQEDVALIRTVETGFREAATAAFPGVKQPL